MPLASLQTQPDGVGRLTMTNSIPQEHLSTLVYLWRYYGAQPRQLAFRAQTPDEWPAWSDALRARLLECLGGFPTDRCDLAPQVVEAVEEPDYRREKVYFYSEPGVAVPCYVLIPRSAAPPYRPVIALHGHGSDGARLLFGLTRDNQELEHLQALNYDYARQLAQHGLMVFVPVLRDLGERIEAQPAFRTGAGPWEKSCQMSALVGLLLGKSLAGLRVWDVLRTVDYIRSRPDPMRQAIGCLGLSGGGVVGLYAAALDERLSAVVIAGALCTFRASIMAIEHCADNYVPGLARYAETNDVAGLIAPRPLLIQHGTQDPIFPIEGVRQAYRDLVRIYALLGCPERLALDEFSGGHRFGGGPAFAWLDRWLDQELVRITSPTTTGSGRCP
jgi:dienelactone hydrolase